MAEVPAMTLWAWVQLGLLPPYVHTHSTYGVLSNPTQMFIFF